MNIIFFLFCFIENIFVSAPRMSHLNDISITLAIDPELGVLFILLPQFDRFVYNQLSCFLILSVLKGDGKYLLIIRHSLHQLRGFHLLI